MRHVGLQVAVDLVETQRRHVGVTLPAELLPGKRSKRAGSRRKLHEVACSDEMIAGVQCVHSLDVDENAPMCSKSKSCKGPDTCQMLVVVAES